MIQKHKQLIPVIVSFTLVSAIYLFFTIATPSDPEVLAQYGISKTEAQLLGLIIAAPVLLIWLFILFGYWKFEQYAKKIKGTNEQKGIRNIANALAIIVVQFIGLGVLGAFLRYISTTTEAPLISEFGQLVIQTYGTILLSLASFYLLYKGAKQLSKKESKLKRKTLGIYISFCILYVAIISLQKLSGTDTSQESIVSGLSLPLLLVSVVFPYTVVWYVGLLAASQLRLYVKKVNGAIYKKIFNRLKTGLMFIVFSSISMQILGLFNEQIAGLTLGPLLALIFVLLFVIGLGYLQVARAAKLLKLIEEV